MVSFQEELDWRCDRLYGLLDKDLCPPRDAVPGVRLGQRAFEIVLARQSAAGDIETKWFERHGSTPNTEIPAHWPEAYKVENLADRTPARETAERLLREPAIHSVLLTNLRGETPVLQLCTR